jgi:RNA polymerase sigma-70 factor (ECF subfamily)
MAIGSSSDLPPRPDRSTFREAGAPEEQDAGFRARLAALDREALGRFYEIYFERIWSYVRRMVGSETAAEDVTQDIFLQLQRTFPSYDPARELAPWVFTIATNKVRDLWRSRRHREESRELSLDAGDDLPGLDPADGRPGPLPELEDGELRRALCEAIERLPAGLRAAFLLRWEQELEFAEIGRILERNEAAARKRYSRALAALRQDLERAVRAGGEA